VKQILVSDCSECPWLTIRNAKIFCTKAGQLLGDLRLDPKRRWLATHPIPDWCPLDDATAEKETKCQTTNYE